MNNSNFSTLSVVLMDIFWNILFFPFWWYSVGLIEFLTKLKNFLGDKQKSLGLLVWMKNIFVPMYGQRDLQGVAISVVMRLVQIVFRSFFMIIWLLIAMMALLLWLLLPVLAVIGIIYQIV